MIAPGTITRDQQVKINELLELVKKADAEETGSRTHTIALSRFLDENPDLWREIHGMVESSLFYLAMTISEGGKGDLEMRVKECEALAEEMGYREAPAIERLLIKQIIGDSMRLYWVEVQHTAEAMKRSQDARTSDYLERRLSAAQKRFTRAIESLARVRKLTRAAKPLEVTL